MEANNKYRQEMIDRYLLGEMDQAEKVAFEAQLNDDPKLQEETELSRHIINALHHEKEQTVIDAMKSMSEEEIRRIINSPQTANQVKTRSLIIRMFVTVAAAACLLIYIGFRPQYSSEQLFSTYYVSQSYETSPSRGDSELTLEERIQLRQAKDLYEQKEYAQALVIYKSFYKADPDWRSLPQEIIFHTAICQFETGDTSGSIEKLTYLTSSDQSEYQEEALWNLSFVYLKENQRGKAKECLQLLIEKDDIYVDKAKELKEKLDKRFLF